MMPCAFARPQPLDLQDAGFVVRHWDVDGGLPGQQVYALAQTPDGYLWIGTEGGLSRYDGMTFKTFTLSHLPGRLKIMSLFCDSRGRLWIGRAGRSLILYEHGRFRAMTAEPGITNNIQAIAEDAGGSIWFLSREGGTITRFHNERIEAAPVAIKQSAIRNLAFGSEGQLLFSTESNAYLLPQSGTDSANAMKVGRTLFAARDGTARIVTDQGLCRIQGGVPTAERPFLINPKNPPLPPFNMAGQDSLGNCWLVGSRSGRIHVSLVRPDGLPIHLDISDHLREMAPLMPDNYQNYFTTSLMCDRNGSVWIGSLAGLYQFRPTLFREPLAVQSLAGSTVLRIREDSAGRLWFVSHGKVVYLDRQQNNLVKTPIPGGFAWLAERETVWAADGNELTHWVLNPDSLTWTAGRREVLPAPIRILHLTPAGELWVGTTDGTYLKNDDGFVFMGPEHGLVTGAMAGDHEGRFYASFGNDGTYRYDGVAWERILDRGESAATQIAALAVDRDGTLWAAGRGPALARWKDGRWFQFEGLGFDWPESAIDVLPDARGGLWLATLSRGIVWLDRNALDAAADGGTSEVIGRSFGVSDGLPTGACAGWGGGMVETRDGQVWATTKIGPAVIERDAARQEFSRLSGPQQAVIEAILVDDAAIDIPPFTGSPGDKSISRIELLPGQSRLEFLFSAPNFLAPDQIRFRYRLDGIDSKWVDGGTDRSTHYQDLPVGKYSFRVAATNSFGVWNERDTSIDVVVHPAWWQRKTVRAAAVLLIAITAGLYLRSIVRRARRRSDVQERFAQQLIESQEQERKRIAGELHDSLGHDLVLIKQSLDLTALRLGKSATPVPEVGHRLAEIAGLTGHAINEIRHITTELQPPELQGIGLSAAIDAMAGRVAEHSGLRVHCHVEDLDQDLDEETAITLYRIIQECLSNTLKHAEAATVWISAHAREGCLRLVYEDDGKGFTIKSRGDLPGGPGFGLAGLQKRARMLTGILTFDTEPGKGFRCTIEIALRAL